MDPYSTVTGVSLLAMPFCFKQCGIVLATLMLILCNKLSRLTCQYLIKSAQIKKRSKFVPLAFYTNGYMGKFLAELSMIGLTLGTCIVYFVVIGDLGSQLTSKMISMTPEQIRLDVIFLTGVFIVLIGGVLHTCRNVFQNYLSVGLVHICFIFKIILFDVTYVDGWLNNVNYWRIDGFAQCLPIFFMAFCCQTQILRFYEGDPSSVKMLNEFMRDTLNILTFVYVCVGFFGYTGFHDSQPLIGNFLSNCSPGIVSEMTKLSFVLSILFNFPENIFLCCESLDFLIFNRRIIDYEILKSTRIARSKFLYLIIGVIIVSVIVSILIPPRLELVLSIMGSTIGIMICLILPAVIYVPLTSIHTQRLTAQCIVIFGILLMVLGLYINLNPMEKSNANSPNILLNQVNPLNVTQDLHISSNVNDIKNIKKNIKNINSTVKPGAKVKKNNLQKSNKIVDKTSNGIFNQTVSTPKDDTQPVLFIAKSGNLKEQSVEKSDKAAVNTTLMPTKVTKAESIEILNDSLTTMQVTTGTTESSKIDEFVTLKAQENLKLIKEKDRLVDLYAIEKKKSEFTDNKDVANVGTTMSYEQFRIMQNDNLNQRQMMQEILEAPKQDLEREMLRMTKVDIFKKSEMEINKKNVMLVDTFDSREKLKKCYERVVKNSKDKSIKESIENLENMIEELKNNIREIEIEIESIDEYLRVVESRV